jgi:hypothetical protein
LVGVSGGIDEGTDAPGDQGEVSGRPEGDGSLAALWPPADQRARRTVLGAKNGGTQKQQLILGMGFVVFGKALAEFDIRFANGYFRRWGRRGQRDGLDFLDRDGAAALFVGGGVKDVSSGNVIFWRAVR